MTGIDHEHRRIARDRLGCERSGQTDAGLPEGARRGVESIRDPLGPRIRERLRRRRCRGSVRRRSQDQARRRPQRLWPRCRRRGFVCRIDLDRAANQLVRLGHALNDVAVLGQIGVAFDECVARLVRPGCRTARDRQVHCSERTARISALRTAARASSSRPGSRERFRNAGAGSPAISACSGTTDSASCRRLGIGRVPSSIGQPLADPNHQLGQLDTLVAELRFGTHLPVHLLRRFTGGGPRSAGHGHVLADIGQGPQNACFTHAKILGMARQERVKIANRRAVIAIFHELDGPVVTLIGQGLDDNRPQPEPQHHEQAERDHQAHDERRRDDTLTAGSTCAFVLQFAKPGAEGRRADRHAAPWFLGHSTVLKTGPSPRIDVLVPRGLRRRFIVDLHAQFLQPVVALEGRLGGHGCERPAAADEVGPRRAAPE